MSGKSGMRNGRHIYDRANGLLAERSTAYLGFLAPCESMYWVRSQRQPWVA